MRVKAIDVLRDVQKVLSDPEKWTTGEYARDSAGRETDPGDKLAVCWCGQGAVYACGMARGMPTFRQLVRDEWKGLDWAKPLLEFLDTVGARRGFKGLLDANDTGGREVVLSIIESAIAELESPCVATAGPGRSTAGRSGSGRTPRAPVYLESGRSRPRLSRLKRRRGPRPGHA